MNGISTNEAVNHLRFRSFEIIIFGSFSKVVLPCLIKCKWAEVWSVSDSIRESFKHSVSVSVYRAVTSVQVSWLAALF